jgi:hypothetical protein
MADANFEAQRMAELMAQVNEELARYGQVSKTTQSEVNDAQMKAKLGIQNFTKGTAKGAEAIMALAGAAGAAGKAMLEGKKGAAAFNESIDGMSTAATAATTALALFVPVLGPLALVVGGAVKAYAAYNKAANEMSDKLYTGYTKMQKAGGAAADGMSGLFRDAKKLGLSMNELDGFTQIVAENSRDFALLAGSVSEGRKQFANIGQSMEPYRASLMRLGLTQDEMNDGMAGYLKLQSRVGLAQNKTTEQLADGARRYLVEQDALTKLTGMTRKEQENAREEIRSQERFAAKLMQVRATQGEEAANELEKTYLMLHSQSKEAAQGFADIATGNLQTEAAQKSYRGSQGESMRSAQLVSSGQMKAAEAAQRVASAHGETAKRLGGTLGQIGVYNSTFGDLAGDIRLGALAQGDINKNYNKTLEDQKAGLAGADKMTKDRADLIKTQQDANKAMETFIFNGIVPAQEKMIMLADATKFAAEKLANMSESGTAGGAATSMAAGAIGGGLIGGPVGAAIGALLGGAVYAGAKMIPKAATGGVLTGPKSGYLAELHGTEVVIPIDKLGGMTTLTGGSGTDSATETKFEQIRVELLKDNVALAKLTDKQLIDQRRYDQVLDRFQKMSMENMEEQMNDMMGITGSESALASAGGTASPAAGGSATGSESSTGVRMSRIVDAAGKLLETRVGGHRNWRNNNPGNIMYGDFAVSMGAIGTDGRFAIFPDMEMGYKAADALMKSKNYQNLTIGDAIKKWAPPSENDTGAYQRTFQKAGFDMGAKYSDMAPAMQRKYLETKMQMEGGKAGQVVSGSSPASSSAAESSAKNLNDLFDFGSSSGSKSNFEQMEGGFKSAVIKAAEEYNATTGKKMRINSAKRDPADQERLYNAYLARGKTGMPVAEPGKSRHERGMAVDIQNYNDSKAVAAMNNQGLYQKVPNDPVHFQFAKGGIGRGPRSGYLATLHGPEAVVPLPDGRTIPVKIQGMEDGKMFDTLKQDMGNMMSQVRDVLTMVGQKMDNTHMVSLMDEMVRSQKSSVDIQNKMLKAQS